MSNRAIGQVVKRIGTAVHKGTIRALNRALSSTSSKMSSDLAKDTGLKKALIKKRVFTKKAKTSTAVLSVATKVGFSLGDFNPKEKKVKVSGKGRKGQRGRPRSRTYYGVTVKIGRQPRQLVPGAWMWTSSRGMKDLVLARKLSLDSKGEYVNKRAARYPTVGLRTSLLLQSAKTHRPGAQQYMLSTFQKNVGHEIAWALRKNIVVR